MNTTEQAVYKLAEQAAADMGLDRAKQISAAREAVEIFREGFPGWQSAHLAVEFA